MELWYFYFCLCCLKNKLVNHLLIQIVSLYSAQFQVAEYVKRFD